MCKHTLSFKNVFTESLHLLISNQIKKRPCSKCGKLIRLDEKSVKMKNRIDSLVVTLLTISFGFLGYFGKDILRNLGDFLFVLVFVAAFIAHIIIRMAVFMIFLRHANYTEKD